MMNIALLEKEGHRVKVSYVWG